jgi:hypothetical protein
MLIGAEFERLLNALNEAQAWEQYRTSPQGEDIADLRSDALEVPYIDDEILDYLEAQLDEMGRLVALPQSRPYDLKAQARKAAIAFCLARYGVQISERKADECRNDFNHFLNSVKSRRE